jgi:hypothetical protein
VFVFVLSSKQHLPAPVRACHYDTQCGEGGREGDKIRRRAAIVFFFFATCVTWEKKIRPFTSTTFFTLPPTLPRRQFRGRRCTCVFVHVHAPPQLEVENGEHTQNKQAKDNTATALIIHCGHQRTKKEGERGITKKDTITTTTKKKKAMEENVSIVLLVVQHINGAAGQRRHTYLYGANVGRVSRGHKCRQ